jgi:magnesium chelatase subunit D
MDAHEVRPVTAPTFPFTAVVGNDLVKKGLLAAMVSPNVTGVLIRGGTGTAKTTLVRGMNGLVPGMKVVNLPLNVSEEQMTGGLDLEAALTEGRVCNFQGLLRRAHGHILYADEINLLPEKTVHLMAQDRSLQRGSDGGWDDDVPFIMIGTMDPDEGDLSAHLMDRFDIIVDVPTTSDLDSRKEILRRGMEFTMDPSGLCRRFSVEEERLRQQINEARDLLRYVSLSPGHAETIAQLVHDLGVEGSRGEIAVARTSMALAALDGREEVIVDDIKVAASLCLGHRRRITREENGRKETDRGDDPAGGSADSEPVEAKTGEGKGPATFGPSAPDRVLPIGKGPELTEMFAQDQGPVRSRKYLDGKRYRVISETGKGRYIASKIPSGRSRDLAFDATLRAAAPYQNRREKNGLAVAIEPSDLREKVRMSKRGSSIIFLVDASGSMGVKERMATVKGTVLTILTDAYRKRDSVGLVIFHRNSADVLLQPTRSVHGAFKKLQEIPTGGRTPLALGLVKAADVISSLMSRGGGSDPSLVVISDGRANVPLTGGDPFNEALDIARELSRTQIRTVVVDTGTGMPRIDRGERLAMALGGSYLRLEDMSSAQLARTIRAASAG